MAVATSPPTTRVIEVVELIANRRERSVRAADIARELGMSKATTHAIVHALVERGWLTRSDPDRFLTLGPGLAPVASAFADQRAITRLAVRAAAGLANATGWSASVVELVEDVMYVSTINPEDLSVLHGQRVAYAAPFGTLFAAWGSPEERLGWLRRGRLNDAAIASYGAHLDQARADGVLIERMSPVVEHVTSLIQAAEGKEFPDAVRQLAGEMLDEVVRTGIGARETGATEHPVTSIAAPVADADGTVATALVLHPLQELSNRAARRAASMVKQAAGSIRLDGELAAQTSAGTA